MGGLEILLIIVALALQPLFALLWLYVIWRIGLSWTAGRTGAWIDNRVETVGSEIDDRFQKFTEEHTQ